MFVSYKHTLQSVLNLRRPRGSQLGRVKRHYESFKEKAEGPWVPTLTTPFPNSFTNAAPDLAQKSLCITVPNQRAANLSVRFVCSDIE